MGPVARPYIFVMVEILYEKIPLCIQRRRPMRRMGFGECFLNDRSTGAADAEATYLLRAARQPENVVGDLDPSASLPATAAPEIPRKRGRPFSSRNKQDDPSLWEPREVNVTITAGSCDIDPDRLNDMELFLEEYCMAGVFALERGGTVCHLHLQGVLRMRAKTVRGIMMITAAIKVHMGWDKGRQPAGSRVMCRSLTNNKLHTWTGLVGYCCKDLHEEHFQVRLHP